MAQTGKAVGGLGSSRTSASEARAQERFAAELAASAGESTLAEDVRAGFRLRQKRLPAKYFYDERGSRLFEEICDLPEYYLTRTEQRLLDEFSSEIIAESVPTDLVELGSGAAKKTRALLDAAERTGVPLRYVPFDVCEPALRESAERLLADYPWLSVHALVGDYERDLERMPGGARRLVAFLGSTMGNFSHAEAAAFLARLGGLLHEGEHLLLGADLAKPVAQLEAAYNDTAGVTAEFNRNLLRVLNRELRANFDLDEFEHVAFFNPADSQIEMHLRSKRRQRVSIGDLGLVVNFSAGETIHTEVSRKFTIDELERLTAEAGFVIRRCYTPEDESFGLVLAMKK